MWYLFDELGHTQEVLELNHAALPSPAALPRRRQLERPQYTRLSHVNCFGFHRPFIVDEASLTPFAPKHTTNKGSDLDFPFLPSSFVGLS